MSSLPDEQKQTAVIKYEVKQMQEMWGDDFPLIAKMFPRAEVIDLVLLFKTASAMKLNPILKEIYALSTSGGTQIYIGKAGIAHKLNEQGGFSVSYERGFDPIAADGLAKRWGRFSGKGFCVDCIVEHRGLRVTARAYWDEYAPESEPKPGSSWLKFPISMLEKVAFCKAGRHLLGINLPAPEEMGVEVIDEDEGDGSVSGGGSVKIIEHAPEHKMTNPSPPIKSEAVSAVEYVEGVLTYRNTPEREVQINGKWYPADRQIATNVADATLKLFLDKKGEPNHFEADNHVKKHFKGSLSLKVITYEELAALYRWKKDGVPDTRWYGDKIAEEQKPAPAQSSKSIEERLVATGLTGNADALMVQWVKDFALPQPYTQNRAVLSILEDVLGAIEQKIYDPTKEDDKKQLTQLFSEAWTQVKG